MLQFQLMLFTITYIGALNQTAYISVVQNCKLGPA